MKYVVQVISFDGEVVKEIPCDYERQAGKVEDGIYINLNVAAYWTRIIQEAA